MILSPAAPEVYEIYDISYSHMDDPEEDMQISVIEEKLSFHSRQKFFSDSSILNSMHSLPMIVSENKEEFDFSISNDVAGVNISNTLDVLVEISYFRSDSFTLIYLELPGIFYTIECTNTQSFEEGENCASTISVKHFDLFHTWI